MLRTLCVGASFGSLAFTKAGLRIQVLYVFLLI